MLLSFAYYAKYVTSEDIDSHGELFIEGLEVSVPSFLLCWIISYTFQKSMGQMSGEAEF